MKKILSALLVCILLLALLPLNAYAEEKSAAERGLEAVKQASNRGLVVLPKEDSYLEEWKVLYARKPWYQPNLPVESLPKLKTGAQRQAGLYEGTRVTVLAEQDELSFILYPGADSKLRVGWIQSIRLLEEFPGERYSIGEARTDAGPAVATVAQRWSNAFLLKSQRRYMCLEQPVEDCTGFTLQYQVVARNTGITENVFGPRTLYVYDGKSWIEAGTFPYEELGAVEVEVHLDEPMKLVAFGTVADCVQPYDFDFRQYAYGFRTVG